MQDIPPKPQPQYFPVYLPAHLLQRFAEARRRFFNPLLLWAIVVGILTGLLGGAFRSFVSQLMGRREAFVHSFAAFPWVGILVAIAISAVMVQIGFFLMRQLAPETAGSGIPQIEATLEGVLPMRWWRVVPVKFISGLFVLSSGMVLGREGPTIQMGGGFGEAIANLVHASREQTRMLVASGAGAGLSAAFNAPLAGILFVIEELRPDFKDRPLALRAVTLACIVATIIVQLLLGQQPSLKITEFDVPPLASSWFFAILGIFLGVIGFFFNILLVHTLNVFSRLRGLPHVLVGLGIGGFIGLLSWFYTPLTGGGEDTIISSFNGTLSGAPLLLIFVCRFALSILCYGSGAPGGIFAPMLSIATTFSQAFAVLVSSWFPTDIPEPSVLAVAGMGGLVAATVRAPLTAIMLTIEMSANYWLILPLLITCLLATMTAHALGGEPIYSVLLARMLGQRDDEPKTSE
jgi:CIC family chloride channel protein